MEENRNIYESRSRRYIHSFLTENLDPSVLRIPPEIEEGNVEYKFKLVDPPDERIEHLVTQMNWRLAEGHGEALYEIGVSDNGELTGLSKEDLDSTIFTLKKMAVVIGAEVMINRILDVSTNLERKNVAEMKVRRQASAEQHFTEIRIAILGGHDAGKSTLLGLLTHGIPDNGRGKSRLNLLRHPHEIESGRTSSISYQIIGFDLTGGLINYASTNVSTWEQICESSSKIVTFLDTCGHPKYQRTTITGLTGQTPDYACLIVPANTGGVPEISKEHLGLAVVLNIPVFVIITKIDIASEDQLTKTVTSLLNLLNAPGIRRSPIIIQEPKDVLETSSFMKTRFMPIFLISNVSGENLSLLTQFLNVLVKPEKVVTQSIDEEVEYQIEEIFSVPDVGCVVGGSLLSGQINLQALEPCIFYIGPHRGRFMPIQINSIHRQRCPVHLIRSGQSATLALSFLASWHSGNTAPIEPSSFLSKDGSLVQQPPHNFRLRRGQVILGPFYFLDSLTNGAFSQDRISLTKTSLVNTPTSNSYFPQYLLTGNGNSSCSSSDEESESPLTLRSVWEFDAELYILNHPSAIGIGCQGTAYCGSVRQQVRVVNLEKNGESSNNIKSTETSNQRKPLGSSPLRHFSISPSKSIFPLRQSIGTSDKQNTVVLRTSEKGRVRFRFVIEPEHVKVGWTVLFRDGRMKSVGKVVGIVKRTEEVDGMDGVPKIASVLTSPVAMFHQIVPLPDQIIQ
ncbi:GTP binding protein [Nowakowskiella sp. JEL0078]|nr:GTP binding protein [Nowakowskiella sp. JEL0078]